MYTTTWCVDCRRAKWFLKERNIPYEEINIEEVEGAEQIVTTANEGKRRVPTFEVNGRTFHCSPYDPPNFHVSWDWNERLNPAILDRGQEPAILRRRPNATRGVSMDGAGSACALAARLDTSSLKSFR